jgi:hypothetical protein
MPSGRQSLAKEKGNEERERQRSISRSGDIPVAVCSQTAAECRRSAGQPASSIHSSLNRERCGEQVKFAKLELRTFYRRQQRERRTERLTTTQRSSFTSFTSVQGLRLASLERQWSFGIGAVADDSLLAVFVRPAIPPPSGRASLKSWRSAAGTVEISRGRP